MTRTLIAIVLLTVLAAVGWATLRPGGGITLDDAYARASNDRAGAVFLTIRNGGAADRLIGVASDAAARVELHDHVMSDGVMQMVHAEQGFAVEARDELVLERGGRHVMFMGLAAPWEQGDVIALTLVFEEAGEMEIEVPVDLSR